MTNFTKAPKIFFYERIDYTLKHPLKILFLKQDYCLLNFLLVKYKSVQ